MKVAIAVLCSILILSIFTMSVFAAGAEPLVRSQTMYWKALGVTWAYETLQVTCDPNVPVVYDVHFSALFAIWPFKHTYHRTWSYVAGNTAYAKGQYTLWGGVDLAIFKLEAGQVTKTMTFIIHP